MECAPLIENEEDRLKALADYGLGPDHPLPSLDPVVQIAARMFDMPVSAVNMIGHDHVFFAASIGVEAVDMSRRVSFCAHAITQDEVMVVEDATRDPRFFDNPLVAADPNVRFYAGVPLRSPDGYPLGALCIIDTKPHPEFSAEDRQRLRELASMASDRLELRRMEFAAEKTRPRPNFEDMANDPATPFIRFDGDLTLAGWNAPAARLFGYGAEEGPGLDLELLLADRQIAPFRVLIAKVVASGVENVDLPPELTGRRQDGREFVFEYALSCRVLGEQSLLAMALRDIA
jgi:PAS domain S-box-containing protein